ncbi:uncharacterized protein LOC112558360 isoform X2 [Pomacea canaliculata]|uniref:uncharacterized protein LOC112558360 isoform X2 n=1 Tax=Pomacea canaliculata TaxID=400727 RepID=UPI000D730C46|nr:uncharacterized protein LOC112558360 isoform X2 [Pomacea canaliculata]
MAYPRLFIAGMPGTGKTVLLLLVATEWLLRGEDVYVLSSCTQSRATCTMLHHLLLQQIQTARCAGTECGQVYYVHYFFCDEVDKALDDFLQKARGGSLHIVIDEPGRVDLSHHLKSFCERLLAQVPSLHLWATRVYFGNIPQGWLTGPLNVPLRFPPVVMREVAKAKNRQLIQKFDPGKVRSFTDGPSVEIMCHQGQDHSYRFEDCIACGWNLGLYLRKLGVTETPTLAATSDSTSPPSLQYKDVFILHLASIGEDSGMLKGLREVGIPVRLLKETTDIEDFATARSDVVWMVVGDNVIGLERKVVVVLEPLARARDQDIRLHYMSRSTSQLVFMLRQPFHSPVAFHDLPSVRNHLGGALAVRRGGSEMARAMVRKQESISAREIHCCLLHSD